jgi:hypothetical protein
MSPSHQFTPASVEADELALAFGYTTFEKVRRKVLVAADAIKETQVWSVYDVPVARGATVGWLVERLDAHDEKLDAAIGVARAYCESQALFHRADGEFRLGDPLPDPTEVPIAAIRKDAAFAKRLAATPAQPTAIAA